MSFGGQDILIDVPPGVPAGDIIVRLMRLVWPSAYFQDADLDDYHPINSQKIMIHGGLSREFFIFADSDAAKAWHRDGATPENSNSMLHFLVDYPPGTQRFPRNVTLVCDELSEPIERLVTDLKESFLSSRPLIPPRQAA
jgi:hypothetical protein